MILNHNIIKADARQLMRTSVPKPFAVAAVYLLIAVIFQYLTSNLIGVSEDTYNKYMNYYYAGDFEKALDLLAASAPGGFQSFASVLLAAVQTIIKAGLVVFCVKTCRKAGAAFGNLLDGFGMALKIIVITFIRIISASILSLFLIFPGVMNFYAYRGALYILIDNPEKGPIQCLRESRTLMKGNKMNLFKLDISFLGWFLLSLIPGLGYATELYSLPFEELSYCLFFDAIRGIEPVSENKEQFTF